MSKYKIGFIGCGNMGGALVTAAAKSIDGAKIAVCDFDKSKTEKFHKEYGAVVTDAKDIAANADFVLLAVKPQVMASAIADFAEELKSNANVTVITIAAGLSIAAIRSYIGASVPMIRIMPNTPAAIGEGR